MPNVTNQRPEVRIKKHLWNLGNWAPCFPIVFLYRNHSGMYLSRNLNVTHFLYLYISVRYYDFLSSALALFVSVHLSFPITLLFSLSAWFFIHASWTQDLASNTSCPLYLGSLSEISICVSYDGGHWICAYNVKNLASLGRPFFG